MKRIILLGFIISFFLLLTITITAQKRMDNMEVVPEPEHYQNQAIEISDYNVAEGNLMDYDSWSN
jgi:hypothetical protein